MLSSSLSRITLTWQDSFDRWRVPWRRDGRKGYHHIVDFYVTPCWVPWAAARCEGQDRDGNMAVDLTRFSSLSVFFATHLILIIHLRISDLVVSWSDP